MPPATRAYTFAVEGRPVPKGRPRLGQRGRVYTPQPTLDAEAAIAEAYRGPTFEGPVAVSIDYEADRQVITISRSTFTSSLRGDLDNYIKTTLDGLQKSGAFENDRAVMELWVAKNNAN